MAHDYPAMQIFLDTEFTDFSEPSLISIALVGVDGREFYAECTDYPREACSDFVRNTVEPLLGRVPGAACNQAELRQRLRAWFGCVAETATIVCDFAIDWQLLVNAFYARAEIDAGINIGEKLVLGSTTINDPVFELAQAQSFSDAWPPHHALADARALRAGYHAWRSEMERVWSTE